MNNTTLNFLNDKFEPNLLPEVCAPRGRLLTALRRAEAGRFIYIGAPAGSGKTVSALLWLNASKRKPVWIGLDPYDNTPPIFYKQLATGLFSLQPENEAMYRVLVSPAFSASPVEHTVRLISEMLPDNGQYALVLDDMHLITNAEVLKSLPFLLRRLPKGFVVLLLSRHNLPEAFTSLVSNENTGIITPEQLRFSRDEILSYFERLGFPITQEQSAFVLDATDGWAIGVNAMAKSGEVRPGKGGQDFAWYFETQLWDKWEPELREFCLKTGVVNEFDPELAEAMTGRADAAEVMSYLSRTNSFLSLLHGNTYRFHHLFQDFLRERLLKSGINAASLYKTAAMYYRDHRDYSRALRFWMDSGDYKGIDSYLYLFLFENNRGVVAEYADFLRAFFVKPIPERAYREFPALHVLSAWYYYLTSCYEEYGRHMDAIIRKLPAIAKADTKFVEYAILAYSVDHRVSMRTKVRRFSLFSRFVQKYTPGGLATSIASFTHNLPYMHRSNLDYSELSADPGILDKIDKTFAPLLGEEWLYIRPGIEACFMYERSQLSEALEQLKVTTDHMSEESKIEGRICVTLLWHRILWQLGRFQEAETASRELTLLVDREAQFFLPNLAAYQTRLMLMDGDAPSAREWLDHYFVVETSHIELFRVYQHFTTARAHIILENAEEAHRLLSLLLDYGENLNRPLDAAEAGTLLSVLKWQQGSHEEAADLLEKALSVLQPYRFIRVVADEGAAVLPVLKRLMTRVEKESYEGRLTRAFVQEHILAAYSQSKTHRGLLSRPATSPKNIKLSRQQKYMLELLSKGYRNADIARITGLALPTIKSHTSLAYKKLEVNNALDAVLKARELGIIK